LITGPTPGQSFGRLGSQSVAVNDSNGHILVADSRSGLVYDFASASDTAPAVWDGSETPASSFGAANEQGFHFISVAVDNSSGDVYVADTADLVIDKFDASGKLIATYGDSVNPVTKVPQPNGQLAGLATPAGSFSHPGLFTSLGIAVDQATHDLYVIDSGHQVIDVFASSGAYLSQIAEAPGELYGGGGTFTDGIAVNDFSEEVLASGSWDLKVYRFALAGGPVEPPFGPFGGGFTSVAANNATGTVFATETSPEPSVSAFTATGEPIGQITGTPTGENGGVAVDQASGHLFVSDNNKQAFGHSVVRIFGGSFVTLPDVVTVAATSVAPFSATLNGTVNPDGVAVSDCHFAYVPDAQFEPSAFDPYAHGASVPCVESVGSGTGEVAVHADLTGLTAGVKYHFRLVATNANGSNSGADETLSTTPPPVISNEAATNLTAHTVDLDATINPGSLETTYHLEYGTSSEYGTEVPGGTIPAGAGDVTLPVVHLAELEENITYHWRVVAHNDAGTTTGPDHTFVYATTGTGTLPDNRAYEMVTPAKKNAALIGDVILGLEPAVAQDGSRLILSSVQCFADAGSCSVVSRQRTGASYEFTRAAGGWGAHALAPAASEFEVSTGWTVSPNTGMSLFSMPKAPSEANELYVKGPTGTLSDVGPVTAPEHGAEGLTHYNMRATSDFSHIVYEGKPGWPFDETLAEKPAMYEYVGAGNSQPSLVGVTGESGSEDLVSTCGTELAGEQSLASGYAMSVDGSRVFFTADGGAKCFGSHANASVPVPVNALYVRANGSETVKISERFAPDCKTTGCETSKPADAEFVGASLDGSRVFFTSTQRLVDGASEDGEPGDTAFIEGCSRTAGVNGCNLYEAELAKDSAGKTILGNLRAVSGGSGAPRVQGVMAVSGDGARIFFVARGILDSTANSQGRTAVAGGENLYVSTRDAAHPAGATRFIGTLAETGEDIRQWKVADIRANVTGDGRFLLFTSQAPLTRDDARASGGPAQVFRYDAVSDSLVRMSVGEEGFNDNGNAGVGDAHIVEAWQARQSAGGQSDSTPSMSADGQSVFFMSPVGLTRGALDDVLIGNEGAEERPGYAQNVYEWRGGHVSLISDGRDANVLPSPECQGTISAVCLVGVGVSGRDVFFTSADRLVPSDTDSQLDFYDARICSSGDPCVSAPPAPLPGCEGEACHGVPAGTPPAPGAPSASFNGAGNLLAPSSPPAPKSLTRAQKLTRALKACRTKHDRHRRAACEHQARKRYGPLRARKARHTTATTRRRTK
jgi:hypothetical protein